VSLEIGDAPYTHARCLSRPGRDAEVIASSLRNAGFSKVTVFQDLSKAAFDAALQAFADEAREADWAFVYFAGHGIQHDRLNYLIPIDADLNSKADLALQAV